MISAAAATIASTPDGSATSAVTAVATPPSAATIATVSSAEVGVAVGGDDRRALPGAEDRHRPAVADRRVVEPEVGLPGTDDEDAPPAQPAPPRRGSRRGGGQPHRPLVA